MRLTSSRLSRLALVAIAVMLTSAAVASSASAFVIGNVNVARALLEAPKPEKASKPELETPASVHIPGAGTPDLNKVGLIKVWPTGLNGSEADTNVLVLEPGTSAAAAYFMPFAKSLVEDPALRKRWQVWMVERRENFLENQSELTKYKKHELVSAENKVSKEIETPSEQFFNYYLGYLADAFITHHYTPVPNSIVEFAKEWGMNVAVEDLKVVIEHAKKLGGKVVLGGHSLGGSIVTAYATWDFGGALAGKPGAEGLSGLVYDDGGSSPTAVSQEEAEHSLEKLDETKETPWLAFGGIPAPDLGLFSVTGSTLTVTEPKAPSLLEKFYGLPPELRSPIHPVTNEAGFGYAVNVGTSPASLIAAQIHGGLGVEATAELDGLHGWNGAEALTPVSRYAEMLSGMVSGTALSESGSEWYFPARLTLDTGAVDEGNANPAQVVLHEHAIHGHELPKSLKILAIDTELDKILGGGNTLEAAELLAEQSGIPKGNLTLIDRLDTYSHNDPAGALPEAHESVEANIFFQELVRFLEGIPPIPTVTTESASSVTRTTATLNAKVDPEGAATSCHFEYGTTVLYGSSVRCMRSPGSGNSAVAVSVRVGGLMAGTEYHFRIVATNQGGTGYGSDRTFMTAP
jgi:pimeloyl-ACP methyl ester carboxylesterase